MMIEFRVFTQGDGWSEWHQEPGIRAGGFSDEVGAAYAGIHGWNGSTSDGYSLTQTTEIGEPGTSGVCMMLCSDGLRLLEYRGVS